MLEVKIDKYDTKVCLSCGNRKEETTKEIKINRDGGTYKGSNIITFNLCNECLRKLAMEFVPYS